MYQMEWVCSAFGSRMDQKQRNWCFLLEGSHWLFPGILLCAGYAWWKSKGIAFVCEGASRRDGVREPL